MIQHAQPRWKCFQAEKVIFYVVKNSFSRRHYIPWKRIRTLSSPGNISPSKEIKLVVSQKQVLKESLHSLAKNKNPELVTFPPPSIPIIG